ncbi:hypothetical protein BSKO_13713 [Bryopsis sp. KO-2023]|nr:hypothetical protein BSKO_13713 [Bryopsis sp. KO-2023]
MAYYDAWKSRGLTLPEKPEALRDWKETVTLEREEDYLIDGSVLQVSMGLGWNAGCDVDASAALFNADVEVVDQVWWKKLASECGAVVHSGDNRTGEEGGDDEVIRVDLAELPLCVHYVLFAVCVFTGTVTFDEVRSAYVRMMHGKQKNHVMFRYNLSELSGKAMIMGILSRHGAYWQFTALGQPCTGRTIVDILGDRENLRYMEASPTFPPKAYVLHLAVTKGRNLVARDSKRLLRKATSDPLVKIKYRSIKFVSKHVEKSLNPEWDYPAVDLGWIVESSPKAVKITIWDFDLFSSNDFMGSLWIPVAALYNLGQGTHEVWFPLTPSKKEKFADCEVTGEILVRAVLS